MGWWREARFGLFIHWGLYSAAAGEWDGETVPGYAEWLMKTAEVPAAEYAKLATRFTGSKFDAGAIVRLARDAGMKYVVLTAKHHDGFAMFRSAASDFNSVAAAPFGRDAVREVAEACAREGLKFGIYYSHAQDWHHKGGAGNFWDPDQQGDYDEYLDRIAVPQVRELLTNYGSIACLWYDTPRHMTAARAGKFRPLHALQPGLIVNDRLRAYDPATGAGEGDTDTPEQFIPANGIPGKDWETCMTLNESWGFKASDTNWKSPATLLRHLSDIASKGGNFLLNIGPTGEGGVPAENVPTLLEIGAWLKRNGESVYGTTAGPFLRRLPWGRATQKIRPDGRTSLYLHVWEVPATGRLVLPGLRGELAGARVLGGGGEVVVEADGEDPAVVLPPGFPDGRIPVVSLDFSGPIAVDQRPPGEGPDGKILLLAEDAELSGSGGDRPRVTGQGELAHITSLGRGSWRVQYSFETGREAVWKVSAEVAPCAYNRITVSPGGVQDPSTTTTVLAWTHGPGEFVTLDFGYFRFPAGIQSIEFKPELQDLRPMEIRRVWLAPV